MIFFKLARRIFQLLLVILGAVTIVFFVGRVLPVDTAVLISGPNASPEMIEAARHRLGLDRPLYEQYFTYFKNLSRGDLGRSAISGRKVFNELMARLPASLELILACMFEALLISLLLAILSAEKPKGFFDRLADSLVYVGTFVPTFLLGTLLLFLFYILIPIAAAPLGRLDLGVTPPQTITGFLILDSLLSLNMDAFLSSLHHILLPSLILAFALLPQLTRVLRENIRKALRSEAVLAARVSGVSKLRIWTRYVLSLALNPFLTLLAASFGYLIGGTVITEYIFGWNGLGSYIINGVSLGDYNVVQGVVIVASITYGLGFFVTDLISWRVDPRVLEEDYTKRLKG